MPNELYYLIIVGYVLLLVFFSSVNKDLANALLILGILIFVVLLIIAGLATVDTPKSESRKNSYSPNLCVVCGLPAKDGCNVCSKKCKELDELNIHYH